MEVGRVNDLSPAFIHPDLFQDTLAFRAVPVTAGIIVELCVPAVGTSADVAAEFTGLTVFMARASFLWISVRQEVIYDLEGALKDLIPEECLKERQASIKPLVEEFFAWIRGTLADQKVLPKGETAKGLNYCLNHEKYLKVFLRDGEVPIDDSASERALRNFTIGCKNWIMINTVRGAQASAIIYSLTETARANDLNVYYYVRHLLTELPQLIYANAKIEGSRLEPLIPWSKTLPADCYSKRRK